MARKVPGRFDTGAVPEPGPGEVIVEVHAVALSGNDEEGRDSSGSLVRQCLPRELGWAGRVRATGPGVNKDLVGRNTVARGAPRARCVPDDHEVVPQDALHLLPDTADLVAATLLRPASVAAEAFEAASLKPGERVVVLGAGVVGLLLVQLLAAASPLELVVVDPDPGLGALALASGATGHCASVDSARVMGVFDLVVETTGTAASPHSACLLAAREARIVFTRTFPPGTRPLDLVQLSLRQLTLLTASVASSKAWSTAVRAFGEGILDPRRLIDDARLPGSRGDALVTVLRGL